MSTLAVHGLVAASIASETIQRRLTMPSAPTYSHLAFKQNSLRLSEKETDEDDMA